MREKEGGVRGRGEVGVGRGYWGRRVGRSVMRGEVVRIVLMCCLGRGGG